ncbi:hypothetical protein D3C87_2101190 [compost metagenome]
MAGNVNVKHLLITIDHQNTTSINRRQRAFDPAIHTHSKSLGHCRTLVKLWWILIQDISLDLCEQYTTCCLGFGDEFFF